MIPHLTDPDGRPDENFLPIRTVVPGSDTRAFAHSLTGPDADTDPHAFAHGRAGHVHHSLAHGDTRSCRFDRDREAGAPYGNPIADRDEGRRSNRHSVANALWTIAEGSPADSE